tara:strand:- start:643 stop:1026 length:384 start_codon:yes stop_codon:yes gene_type:complete
MALTWDLTAIKDSDKICWIPDKEDKDKVEMGVLTNTLIWATMLVGMNSITEKNSKEFHRRLIEFEVICGDGMLVDGEGKTRQPTLKEIQLHVGLKTNATVMESRKWGNNLKRLVKEEASRRINGHLS